MTTAPVAAREEPGPVGEEILAVRCLSHTYPAAVAPALVGVTCAVREGECVCLSGSSGSGKTTLLMAIRGLLHGGKREGDIHVSIPPGDDGKAAPAGIVFQNAESQILCTTVAEEVAFGPENLCVAPAEIARRVESSLKQVGLAGCESRSVERFSAGQKQRLAIASVLSMRPALLLLDEPASQLDGRGKIELCALLASLKRQGYAILMAEHDPRPFADLIDRYLFLEGGRIVGEARVPESPPPGVPFAGRYAVEGGETAIAVMGLSLSYPETGKALRDVTFRVGRGERVHLFGVNGAGKSSLLRCLAGLEPPDAGTIEVAGIAGPRPEKLPGRVGFLFQNPARQLFAESVREEVGFTLGRLGRSPDEAARIVAETLELCGIGHLAERPPLTLSFGEQHRVALASVLAPRPAVLLLDEPFAGLDMPQRRSLLELLAAMPARYGTTVLIASHDELPAERWAERTLFLKEGSLGASS